MKRVCLELRFVGLCESARLALPNREHRILTVLDLQDSQRQEVPHNLNECSGILNAFWNFGRHFSWNGDRKRKCIGLAEDR